MSSRQSPPRVPADKSPSLSPLAAKSPPLMSGSYREDSPLGSKSLSIASTDFEVQNVTTWSYTPKGGRHAICVAVDQSIISRSSFESVLSFAPKKIHILRCLLPGEPDQTKHGTEEAVYGEIAVKHNMFVPMDADHIHVKSAAEIPSAIISYALRSKCELIALGTRRREEKHGVHTLGFVTDSVVRQSHIPVYVVRTSLIQKPSLKYVIAIDGSKITDYCIDCIRSLARPDDEIIVVACLANHTEAEAMLHAHVGKIEQSPVPQARVTTKACPRNAQISLADNICDIANELDADCLVLSTGWKRSTSDLGSVTSSCIYQPKLRCNLFIYKNPKLLEVPISGRRGGSISPS